MRTFSQSYVYRLQSDNSSVGMMDSNQYHHYPPPPPAIYPRTDTYMSYQSPPPPPPSACIYANTLSLGYGQPMSVVEGMEFLLEKMKGTKNNADFAFICVCRVS